MKYTNQQLADAYFKTVMQYSTSRDGGGLLNQKRFIAKASTEIAEFYKKHGNLAGLKAQGIGQRTKAVLELILEKGAEEAYRIVGSKIEEQIRRGQFDTEFEEERTRGHPITKISLTELLGK